MFEYLFEYPYPQFLGGIAIALALAATAILLVALSNYWAKRQIKKKVSILIQLADGPRYGLDLIKGSDGLLRRGTVYVHLVKLENMGFIVSELIPSHRPGALSRRLYRLSEEPEESVFSGTLSAMTFEQLTAAVPDNADKNL